MANTDPPDEIRDVEGPPYRNVDAPDPDTSEKQASDGEVQYHKKEKRNAEAKQPTTTWWPF
jgi:hypothetical protein